jgi:hypothetical protein
MEFVNPLKLPFFGGTEEAPETFNERGTRVMAITPISGLERTLKARELWRLGIFLVLSGHLATGAKLMSQSVLVDHEAVWCRLEILEMILEKLDAALLDKQSTICQADVAIAVRNKVASYKRSLCTVSMTFWNITNLGTEMRGSKRQTHIKRRLLRCPMA